MKRFLLLAVVLLVCPRVALADPIEIDATRLVDRDLGVWFGTLSIVGVLADSQSFVTLTEIISPEVKDAIDNDPTADARITANLPDAYLNPAQSGIEWAIEGDHFALPSLPAEQDLVAAYLSAALALEALYGPGSLTLGDVAAMTTASYLLGSFDTIEFSPVFVGDSDNPVVLDPFQNVTIHNTFAANVQYFERNAVWTADLAPTPVPEPGTIGLLLTGLAGLTAARRRARRRR
jgi:hypothetical protein